MSNMSCKKWIFILAAAVLCIPKSAPCQTNCASVTRLFKMWCHSGVFLLVCWFSLGIAGTADPTVDSKCEARLRDLAVQCQRLKPVVEEKLDSLRREMRGLNRQPKRLLPDMNEYLIGMLIRHAEYHLRTIDSAVQYFSGAWKHSAFLRETTEISCSDIVYMGCEEYVRGLVISYPKWEGAKNTCDAWAVELVDAELPSDKTERRRDAAMTAVDDVVDIIDDMTGDRPAKGSGRVPAKPVPPEQQMTVTADEPMEIDVSDMLDSIRMRPEDAGGVDSRMEELRGIAAGEHGDVAVKGVTVDGDRVTISTDQVTGWDPELKDEIRGPGPSIDMTRAEFQAFLQENLVNHYWYDPLSGSFVSSYDGPGQGTFGISPEMVAQASPETYQAVIRHSKDEAWNIAQSSYDGAVAIEAAGVKPRWQEYVEFEMRVRGVVTAGGEAVAEEVASLVAPVPAWVGHLDDAHALAALPSEVIEAAQVVSQSSSDGWTPNAGGELLESFGGQKGIERWLVGDPVGNQVLFEYGGWTPSVALEYDGTDFDRRNVEPSHTSYTPADRQRMQEVASQLAPQMANQILMWDRCNLNMERAQQIERALSAFQAARDARH